MYFTAGIQSKALYTLLMPFKHYSLVTQPPEGNRLLTAVDWPSHLPYLDIVR